MAVAPHLSVGGVFYVTAHTAPATNDVAGFEALTWVEVKGVSKGPDALGVEFNTTEFKYLKDGFTAVLKGSQKPSTWPVEMATMEDDPGQVILAAGNDGANKADTHSFKWVRGNGYISYGQGKITGLTESMGDADTVPMRKCGIALTAAQVDDAPA
jgi:hypothetical protein